MLNRFLECFSKSYIKNHCETLFKKKSRDQNINNATCFDITCHYHTRCLTSATPECNVRSEKCMYCAVYCPLRWRLRTFEMGILAMWMMENVRYLSGHLFLAELSPCRKCHGIYRRRERSRSREVCQPSLLFSLLSSGWKTVAPKKALNSA